MTTMSKLEAPNQTPRKSRRNPLISAAIGAVGAFVLVYLGLQTGSSVRASGAFLNPIGISEIAAALVGAMLLMCAVIVAIGASSPSLGVKMDMFEDADEWEDERKTMWLSVVGCLSYGLAMVLLALVGPLDLAGNVPLLAVIAALAVIFGYTCWKLVKRYDELWVGVNSETCTIAMYLTLLTGGSWSIIAHLGFAPQLGALDWITLLGATSIVGAIVSTYRRGMLADA